MDDLDITKRISELTAEEHDLQKSHTGQGLSEDQAARMKAIDVALDQCWDLLRQRRAKRDGDQNADDATVRTEGVVEGYQQ